MLGLNVDGNSRLRAVGRGASFWGTVCCGFGVLLFVTGCPPVTPTSCTADADCNDNNACTTDTCDTGVCDNTAIAGCCTSDAQCTGAGEVCDTTSNTCVTGCTSDAECDDGDACNGAETCGADGVCVSGTAINTDDGDLCTTDACDPADGTVTHDPVQCNAGELCDPATGLCGATPCTVDADCDDSDMCTTDSCDTAAGTCSNVAVDCDDGDLCTTDTCDPTDGTCANTAVTCPAGEACDATSGQCTGGTACTSDADCADDGTFCNGTESCNTTTSLCVSSGNPCDTANGFTCNEDLNQCDAPPGITINFTLSVDNLSGTGGDDTFAAPLGFNAPTGTTLPTIGNSDTANGGDGADVLNATTNITAGATTINATLTGIESLNFTDQGTAATTFNGTNFTGVTGITLMNSTNGNALVVNNLPTFVPNAGMTNIGTGAGGLTLSFATAGTSATNDTMNLSINNVTAGTFTITSNTSNGIETLNVTSSGGNANTLAALTQTTGNTLATLNLAGDQDLTITGALPNSVATIDASGGPANGAMNMTAGAASTAVTFRGGNGNDTIVFGTTYTTADIIDGGAGTDTLSLVTGQAAPTSNQTNVSNMESLTISNAHTTSSTVSRFGSITTVNLPFGSNGGTLIVGDNAMVTLGARGANNDSAGTLTVTMSPDTNTDDLTLTLNDADSTAAVTLTTVDTLNLVSNLDLDGSAADGGANTFTTVALPDLTGRQILVTGTEALTFSGAVTARTINASTFAHNLTMALNTTGSTANSTVATGGASITGGTGNDILTGSTAGDSIDASTGGNDVIQPGRGIDTVTFGTGICTLDLEDLAVGDAVAANRVTVTGFEASSTAFSSTSGSVDAIRFDNITTQGDLSDGAVVGEFQSVTTPANVTVTAGVGIVELAFEFSAGVNLGAGGANELNGTTLLSACGAASGTSACTFTTNANDNDIIIIAYQSSNAYIYHGNGAGTNTALINTEIALIATISGGIPVGGFDVTQFIN